MIKESTGGEKPKVHEVVAIPSSVEAAMKLLEAVDDNRAAEYSKDEILEVLKQNGIPTDDVSDGVAMLRRVIAKQELTIDDADLSPAEKDLVDYFGSEEERFLAGQELVSAKTQEPPEVITAVAAGDGEVLPAIPEGKEAQEGATLADYLREIQGHIEGRNRARQIARQSSASPSRIRYADGYIAETDRRFHEIADMLGIVASSEQDLMALIEKRIEKESGESSPTSEGDNASQLTERSNRDEYLAFIGEGKIEAIPMSKLRLFRHQPEVQNFVARVILAKLDANKNVELDAMHGHDWRLGAAKSAPGISDEERARIHAYLLNRLISEAGDPSVLPERPTAIEQLKERAVEYEFPHMDGLDDAADGESVRALKDDLVYSGLTPAEARSAIINQKNVVKDREGARSKKPLSPYDVVEIRRDVLGKIATDEIARTGAEVTADDFAAASAMPALDFTPEIGELDGDEPGASPEEAPTKETPSATTAPSLVVNLPVLTNEVKMPKVPMKPVATAAPVPLPIPPIKVSPMNAGKEGSMTPNQAFSQRMRQLEREANQLAKKTGLRPEEKAKLAALEQEMSDLEAAYLKTPNKNEKKADDELDAQGEAMMHLIGTMPVVRVNMNDSTPGFPLSAEVPPTATVVPKTEKIPDGVVHRFETALGVSEESLEKIPGFRKLSPGKQLLVLQYVQNEVLLDVTKNAKEEQRAEWKGRSLWGKIWRGAVTMGSYQFARTKEIEKELLSHATGTGESISLHAKMHAEHLANIEEYVKVMLGMPEVTENKDGGLDIAYAAPQYETVTPEAKKIIDDFNSVASRFAAVPREWGYEPKDEKEKGQRERYDEEKIEYDNARAALLAYHKESFKKDGTVKDPEKEAMLEMSRIDGTLALNQLYNAHPDAEKALEKIEDQSAILAGMKEFWEDKGKFIALGSAARIAVTAVTGAVTGGIGAIVIAASGGALVGGMQGVSEAKKVIRERRIDRRLSEEDEREEISYKDSSGVSHARNIKEYTDAAFFTDRIERLSEKLDTAKTKEERALLESKIVKTTALMEEKFKRGLINFGGSSLERGDARKGNDIANKLSFIEAMGKGAAVEIVDREKLKAEMDRIVGIRQDRIEDVRDEEVTSVAMKAALWRAGYAGTASWIVGEIHESGFADTFFRKINELKDQYPGSGNGRGEADAIALRPRAAASAAAPASAAASAPAPTASAPTPGGAHEVVLPSRAEAEDYARDILNKDMLNHDTAAKELLSAEWRYLSGKNAKFILSLTRDEARKIPGAADMYSSAVRMQEYAKMNGFIADGILPNDKETLEEYFLRAHALHAEKHGYPEVKAAVPAAPAASAAIPQSPEQVPEKVYVPPKLVGGPGAVPHAPSPDGGVPQDGGLGRDTPRVEKLPPPPPPPPFRVPSPSVPRMIPPLEPPPPPPEFMNMPTPTIPRVIPPLAPPPPPPPFMSAAPSETPVAFTEAANDGFVKTSFIEQNAPRMEHVAANIPVEAKPASIFEMNEAETVSHTKFIADKWTDVAAKGPTGSSHWSASRTHGAAFFQKGNMVKGQPGTPEEADYQMQSLFKKLSEMGFAPSDTESAGEYVDRAAKELHEPMLPPALAARAHGIALSLEKYMPTRTKEIPMKSASEIYAMKNSGIKLAPTEAKDVEMIYRVMTRVEANTGVHPRPGQTVREYLEEAARTQLAKTPTLHAVTLLTPKGAASAIPQPAPRIPVPPLRWDQQA